jgi:drug/metabolite transporter (DMT)-like permease
MAALCLFGFFPTKFGIDTETAKAWRAFFVLALVTVSLSTVLAAFNMVPIPPARWPLGF